MDVIYLSSSVNGSPSEIILKGHNHKTDSLKGELNCDACDDQSFSDSSFCLYCKFTIHHKCTFVFSIPEHLSHGHYLKLLTTGAPAHSDPKCHICGKKTKRLLYHCSTCNLNMDIDCMVDDLSAEAVIYTPWHHHPLVMLDLGNQILCEVCGCPDGYGYFCPTCKLMVHEKCVSVFYDLPEITHPLHVKHSLKLLTNGAPHYTDPECHVCGDLIENFLYHCDICKFNLDMACANEDHDQHTLPPVVLSNLKVHEDTLTLIPRLISFICNACGMKGDRSPYVSFQGGDLMFFHQKCARLPRVIHVNRHDHRVSYKYPLGPGKWTCEICLEDIDWSYGAFSCSLCPNYVLHSRCATRDDVWDGEELDGEPEEIEDSEPFKLNDDNTITHFAHEQHNMSLNKEGIALEESILCEGCVRPIASDTFYKCSVCNFILHETCANLPKTRRHFLSPKPLRLRLISNEVTSCDACIQYFTAGFVYTDGDYYFDLVCCSITVPFIHDSHEHPLLYSGGEGSAMNSCHNCVHNSKSGVPVIGCMKCNYYLDFRCATLPLTVSLRNHDDHPLTLCFGEEASGKYWCNICEREINPEKWFYTCNDCCITIHTFCVVGNMIRYVKPGVKLNKISELMLNNTSRRPSCYNCSCRCMGPYFFVVLRMKSYCSYYCMIRINLGESSIGDTFGPPPWIYKLHT